jgi:hypothetical protein
VESEQGVALQLGDVDGFFGRTPEADSGYEILERWTLIESSSKTVIKV